MKITALEEYGLRCLLRVADQPDGESISAQAIADMEGLSLSYTQKILRTLSLGGLIDSRRGAHGGFYLVSDASETTLGDVMRVLGGMLQIDQICERHTGELLECSNSCHCAIRPVWKHISEFVIHTLDNIPLALLIEDEHTVSRHLQAVRESHLLAQI